MNEPTYEITVWDWEGDIVEKHWQATEEELIAVEEYYRDDPTVWVEVEIKE